MKMTLKDKIKAWAERLKIDIPAVFLIVKAILF